MVVDGEFERPEGQAAGLALRPSKQRSIRERLFPPFLDRFRPPKKFRLMGKQGFKEGALSRVERRFWNPNELMSDGLEVSRQTFPKAQQAGSGQGLRTDRVPPNPG